MDLEVSPRLAWSYGYYETTPIKVEQEPILLSFAWKFVGEKKVQCLTLFDRGLVDPLDDRLLVKELWNILDESSILVWHNGKRFDHRVCNYLFLKHKLTPPSPYKQIDTLQEARKYFKFDCNKLDNISRFLGGEGKTKETNADCWYDLLYGNKKEKKKASDTLRKYNSNDIIIMEKLYERFTPWADNRPNLALYGEPEVCPRCGQNKGFKIKAYRRTGAQINGIQYCCQNCGAYITRKLDKEEREALKEQGTLTSTFRNLAP